MSREEKKARSAEGKQERGALLFSLMTIVLIAVIGAPCFCYFGAGLFHGVHILRTGHQVNPARQTLRKSQKKRDPKYNRTFPRAAESTPASTSPMEP